MKKEIIVSSAISIIASVMVMAGVSYVFSWSEPSAIMPSEYIAPINTSDTGQAKYGELSATIFRDTSNQNYYVDPAGTSIIGKMIQTGAITTSDSDGTVATIGYVNSVLSQDVAPVTLYWRTGTSSACDSGDKTIYSEDLVKLCGIVALPSNALYQGSLVYPHTETDCINNGGTLMNSSGVATTTGSGYFCRFDSSSCPSGWAQYGNWTTTTPYTAYYFYANPYCSGDNTNVTTGSHAWANIAPETTPYYWKEWHSGYVCVGGTITANVTQRGCY